MKLAALLFTAMAASSLAVDQVSEEAGSSKDGTITVLQMGREQPDSSYLFHDQIIDKQAGKPWLLNPTEAPRDAAYPAAFRFSADNNWLVRMQKVAAGRIHAAAPPSHGGWLHSSHAEEAGRSRLGFLLHPAAGLRR